MVVSMTPLGQSHMDEYRYKRSIDELRFHYVVNPASPHSDWVMREVMEPAFRALRVEYGITVEPLPFGVVPPRWPDGMTYLVYGPTNPLRMTAEEREYLASVAATGCRTNIVSAYPLSPTGADLPGYEWARTAVPELCDALDVNAIFPDEIDLARSVRTNTWQDVYVNAIGETVRLKYHPTQSPHADDESVRRELAGAHAGDIAELARLHRDHRLWQRQPYTDGSILFTHDGHWFVSQTMLDKTLMTPADFDLVSSFDEGLRAVTYTGSRLPSSDTPELCMLSSLLSMHSRRPKLIVHFHHRELTRGQRFRELVTERCIEGGRFAAGREYFRELRARNTDWFIVREHGMVWVGDSVAEFGAYVRRVVSS